MTEHFVSNSRLSISQSIFIGNMNNFLLVRIYKQWENQLFHCVLISQHVIVSHWVKLIQMTSHTFIIKIFTEFLVVEKPIMHKIKLPYKNNRRYRFVYQLAIEGKIIILKIERTLSLFVDIEFEFKFEFEVVFSIFCKENLLIFNENEF